MPGAQRAIPGTPRTLLCPRALHRAPGVDGSVEHHACALHRKVDVDRQQEPERRETARRQALPAHPATANPLGQHEPPACHLGLDAGRGRLQRERLLAALWIRSPSCRQATARAGVFLGPPVRRRCSGHPRGARCTRPPRGPGPPRRRDTPSTRATPGCRRTATSAATATARARPRRSWSRADCWQHSSQASWLQVSAQSPPPPLPGRAGALAATTQIGISTARVGVAAARIGVAATGITAVATGVAAAATGVAAAAAGVAAAATGVAAAATGVAAAAAGVAAAATGVGIGRGVVGARAAVAVAGRDGRPAQGVLGDAAEADDPFTLRDHPDGISHAIVAAPDRRTRGWRQGGWLLQSSAHLCTPEEYCCLSPVVISQATTDAAHIDVSCTSQVAWTTRHPDGTCPRALASQSREQALARQEMGGTRGPQRSHLSGSHAAVVAHSLRRRLLPRFLIAGGEGHPHLFVFAGVHSIEANEWPWGIRARASSVQLCEQAEATHLLISTGRHCPSSSLTPSIMKAAWTTSACAEPSAGPEAPGR